LETCLSQAKCNQRVLEVFLSGAHRMEFIGQRMLDGVQAAQLYEQARQTPADMPKLAQVQQLIRKNRDAYARLGQQFAALWLSESKPYALDWTLGRYTNAVNECEALLVRVETARQAAASSGQPMPAADELQTALPPRSPRRERAGGVGAGVALGRPVRHAPVGTARSSRRGGSF
jgi:hypothetical protein